MSNVRIVYENGTPAVYIDGNKVCGVFTYEVSHPVNEPQKLYIGIYPESLTIEQGSGKTTQ